MNLVSVHHRASVGLPCCIASHLTYLRRVSLSAFTQCLIGRQASCCLPLRFMPMAGTPNSSSVRCLHHTGARRDATRCRECASASFLAHMWKAWRRGESISPSSNTSWPKTCLWHSADMHLHKGFLHSGYVAYTYILASVVGKTRDQLSSTSYIPTSHQSPAVC
jgi:hypothetical protein